MLPPTSRWRGGKRWYPTTTLHGVITQKTSNVYERFTATKEAVHIWDAWRHCTYEGISKSFRAGRLERELQMVQLSATRCSCIVILWVRLVSFAAITLCVASQRVFVRKLSDLPSYRHCVVSNVVRSVYWLPKEFVLFFCKRDLWKECPLCKDRTQSGN
jgi:hypothetical protein